MPTRLPFLFSRIIALVLLATSLPAWLTAQLSYAAPYRFETFAGAAPYGHSDGIGPAAQFRYPGAITLDGAGNLYVADTLNHLIRRISPSGVTTTLAGLAETVGSADGAGAEARFYGPSGVARDGLGNLYVADTSNSTIRKITPAGVVTTLAGMAGHSGSADGTGTSARFSSPRNLVLAGDGNLYVADMGNSRIRKITTEGVVTTLAGSTYGAVDGIGTAAKFKTPIGLAVGPSGDLFVADSDAHAIRRVTLTGVVTTFAGSLAAFTPGATDGTGAAARFFQPVAIAADSTGNLYVADSLNRTIRKISPGAEVTTWAGATDVRGWVDATGSAARFYEPNGVAATPGGVVYVADAGNNVIRQISPGADVTTLAGVSGEHGLVDGMQRNARFSAPADVAIDQAGNVYVADSDNEVIRKISPAGAVSVFAGTAGSVGAEDGSLGVARFSGPKGIAVDALGNVYVSDQRNYTIRKVTPNGAVSTLAGVAGQFGYGDGVGTAARFGGPGKLAVDNAGNVYVPDAPAATIRKIAPDGTVTTFAGAPGESGYADGAGTAARFRNPVGVDVDLEGNVYVADAGNYVVRKITSAGVVTTLAGTAGEWGAKDGVGGEARFEVPYDVAVQGDGSVFVAENFSRTIRKITPTGVVTTVAGSTTREGTADGIGGEARFITPWAIAVSRDGSLYVADIHANTVRKGSPSTTRVATDFNVDGAPDIMLENAVTGQRVLWLMGGPNNAFVQQGLDLGFLDVSWKIVGTADFNGDGGPDILLENGSSGQRVLWLMGGPNNAYVQQGLDLGFLDPTWRIVGTADFNADGGPDILLENSVTGQRVLWLMGGPNNAYVQQGLDLGVLDAAWHIAGVADFNTDGGPDILLEHTTSGQRVLWLMGGPNNAYVQQGLDLGVLDAAWRIVKTVDFNNDKAPDILLEHATSGQRVLWLMGGPNNAYVSQGLDLGVLDHAWRIAK